MKSQVNVFKNLNKRDKLIAVGVSFLVMLLLIIGIYFFCIRVLEADGKEEVKFLSLSDSKVVNVYKMLDVFSDKYNPEIEPEYEKFITEFYNFEDKTPENFSDELKMFIGVSNMFDYRTLDYNNLNGVDTRQISIVDIKKGAQKVFGNNLEYNIKPFNSGVCHFGEFFEVLDSLMYDVKRDLTNCEIKNSQFITELITAQEDGSKIKLEIQTGFVNIEDGIPVLYSNPDKNGLVSDNISEFNKSGSYVSALSTYKNNLNLYTVIFEYTGTEYRFVSIERTR